MPKEDQDALAQKLDKETALRIAIEDKLAQTEAVLAKSSEMDKPRWNARRKRTLPLWS